MFDIFLFLFENYPQIDRAPDRDTLAIKLNAAGFEINEIEQVLDWLGELTDVQFANHAIPHVNALRHYTTAELAKLDTASRGFLLFLQQSGMINAAQREWIIERVMALDEDDIEEKIRWIALVLLWSQHPEQNIVLLEDMIFHHNATPTVH